MAGRVIDPILPVSLGIRSLIAGRATSMRLLEFHTPRLVGMRDLSTICRMSKCCRHYVTPMIQWENIPWNVFLF